MEIRDFIVLFIAVSLLINVAFIMVPAVNRSCEAIPDRTIITEAVELDQLRELPSYTTNYFSITNNEIYSKSGTVFFKLPYNYATNSIGEVTIVGTLEYNGENGFTVSGNKIALLISGGAVFLNIGDSITSEFTVSSIALSGDTVGISMLGNYLFTHASDGTIHRYNIDRAGSTLTNGVVIGNVGLGLTEDISTSGNKLYTMSSTGTTLYQYTIGPNSLSNKTPIALPDNQSTTIDSFTTDGSRVFIKLSSTDELQVYKITIAGDGATSWRDACVKSEAIAQSSFRIIGIITLLVAVAAVVFAIKKLDLLG